MPRRCRARLDALVIRASEHLRLPTPKPHRPATVQPADDVLGPVLPRAQPAQLSGVARREDGSDQVDAATDPVDADVDASRRQRREVTAQVTKQQHRRLAADRLEPLAAKVEHAQAVGVTRRDHHARAAPDRPPEQLRRGAGLRNLHAVPLARPGDEPGGELLPAGEPQPVRTHEAADVGEPLDEAQARLGFYPRCDRAGIVPDRVAPVIGHRLRLRSGPRPGRELRSWPAPRPVRLRIERGGQLRRPLRDRSRREAPCQPPQSPRLARRFLASATPPRAGWM